MEKKKLQSRMQDKFETTTDIPQITPFQLKIILGRLLLTGEKLAAGMLSKPPWPLSERSIVPASYCFLLSGITQLKILFFKAKVHTWL